MELNREQIITALKCCDGTLAGCKECPNYSNRYRCKIEAEALALIKELTEESERHSRAYQIMRELNDTIRADTVRKMQERLKQELRTGNIIMDKSIADIIDQIAKEMLEGV